MNNFRNNQIYLLYKTVSKRQFSIADLDATGQVRFNASWRKLGVVTST